MICVTEYNMGWHYKAYTPLALRARLFTWPTWGTGQMRNAENKQHQLLHCQTIVQCIMLNADVCKGEVGLVKCGQGEGN